MTQETKGFWTSMAGVLTGIAALVTAATGLYVAVRERPDDRQDGRPGSAVAAPASDAAKPRDHRRANESQRPTDIFTLTAVIDDPDGYTNVRRQRSASSEIVAKLTAGERFYTYKQPGNWWQVKTAGGAVGYVHVSRIKLVSGNVTGPPAL
jgi:hypothetical protein